MQERYLGDVHDYFKFLFLKFLSSNLKMKIGLNWYLVNPFDLGTNEIQKNDGEKRNYLFNSHLKMYDCVLIKEFKKLKKKKLRNIHSFTKHTHLKPYINFFDDFIDMNNRKQWLLKSLNHHKNEKIIFLDPDNGFIKEKNGKSSLKYILPEDCKLILDHKKIIIFCQFQSFRKNTYSHISEVLQNLENCGLKTSVPIIRNRTGPNTFFITINPKNVKVNFKKIFEEYTKKFPKVELLEIL